MTHVTKPELVRDTLGAHSWEVLPPLAAYSLDFVPSDYDLFCIDDFTHLLSSALVRTKMWKSASMNGLQ